MLYAPQLAINLFFFILLILWFTIILLLLLIIFYIDRRKFILCYYNNINFPLHLTELLPLPPVIDLKRCLATYRLLSSYMVH